MIPDGLFKWISALHFWQAKVLVSKILSSLIDLYDCIFILLFSSARPS